MTMRPVKFLTAGCAALAILTSAPAFAQSASADSAAEIAVPITISRVSDLQFGDIIAGSGASTVIVEPILETRTVATGDATAFGGTVTAAEFSVQARPLLFYQIGLPGSTTLTSASTSETMVVNNFTLDGPPARFLTLLNPVGNFKVGGTLNVGADQENGFYDGSFSVTVNYF